MKKPSFLGAFLLASTISTCYAEIPWWVFNCAGVNIAGASVDQIWENAKLMASRAIERLNEAKGRDLPGQQMTAADNAKWMFGTKPLFGLSLNDDDKAVLDSVINIYNTIINMMSRNSGYFFCGDSMFTYGVIDDNNNRAWHVTLPGPSHTLVFSGTMGQNPLNPIRVCRDPEDVLGTNLVASINLPNAAGNLVPQPITVIVFCPENFTPEKMRMIPIGVLPLDYQVTGKRENPDNYRTAAGTLLHEMVHAIDPLNYRDQRSTLYPDTGYGYAKAWQLAQKEQHTCFKNPDNYAVFAQMSLADKKTKWGAPSKFVKNPT